MTHEAKGLLSVCDTPQCKKSYLFTLQESETDEKHSLCKTDLLHVAISSCSNQHVLKDNIGKD